MVRRESHDCAFESFGMSKTASVIIPTHNRHNQIGKTVSALRKQNLPADSYEIIVVDDGSTPPIKLTFEGSPDFTLLRLENVERSAARNAAI